MTVKNHEKVNVLGVSISNLSKIDLTMLLISIIEKKQKEMLLNVNIYCMNIAYENSWFKEFLNSASIVFCDGEGVRVGAFLLGKRIREKITYNRWIWDLATISEEKGFSWYLIGSKENVIHEAVEKLKHTYPGLRILGYRNGYFNNHDDVLQTIEHINLTKPNILILGMGMPIQEKWLADNFSRLNVNIALTGGAVFEYISGYAKMTPNWAYKLKIEWFYRFIHDPKRLFKRYMIGNPLFIYRILKEMVGFRHR